MSPTYLFALTLLVAFTVKNSAAGPLNQISSLVKTHYESDSKKKMSVQQEREQLYEAYNLLHSLAQVRGPFRHH
jgi:hypothetical protein